jgi:hypothetical protein
MGKRKPHPDGLLTVGQIADILDDWQRRMQERAARLKASGLDFESADLSGSFPFFDIARRAGVPYREVLRLVDAYDRDAAATVNDSPLSLELCCLIYEVTQAPWRKSIEAKEARDARI